MALRGIQVFRFFSLPKTLTLALALVRPFSCVPETLDAATHPRDVAQLFQMYGCDETDVSKILHRQPSLARADLRLVQSNLDTLQGLGLGGADLVKIVTCRPRFLSGRIGHGLDGRVRYLESLFGSPEMLLKAIVRNPSLLNYDVGERMKPCVALYDEMGVSREDLAALLISRPMIMSRSSLNEEKLEYIHRTGLSNQAKMYKYVVSLIAVSRLDTIRKKVANFGKFGFSIDEVMGLFSRTPNVLTLSVDKVRRNMTYIIGIMKLPARVVLDSPFLVYSNLEAVLKPRFQLAKKIEDMGLEPQIMPYLISAMKMKEPRFLKAFITCHEEEVAEDLMEFYTKAKCVKRLAQDSKTGPRNGFPF